MLVSLLGSNDTHGNGIISVCTCDLSTVSWYMYCIIEVIGHFY